MKEQMNLELDTFEDESMLFDMNSSSVESVSARSRSGRGGDSY